MARKGKQVSRKRKTQLPEEEKQNELILEEVLSISGKNVEKVDESTPARLKRSANKSNDAANTQTKKSLKKRSVSPSSSTPSKQKKCIDKEEANAVDDVKASTFERGDPVPNLPDGWRRQVVVRKSGKSAGQMDVYFYSPDGIKLRSRPDVASYIRKHKIDVKIEEFDFSKPAKTTEAIVKIKAPAENSTVSKKKNKTVQEEKSKDGVQSKDSSKNVSTKVSAEVPLPADTEEKNDAVGKTDNKAVPEEKKNTVEMNGKEKEKNSTTKKRKIQMSEEDEKQNEMIAEVSIKRLEKADGLSSARLKRSANKSVEMISTQPKKLNTKQKESNDEVKVNTVNEVETPERGEHVPNLPDGWRRQAVVRKTGAGKIDIYFYSPDGTKLRSRPDVASYLRKHKIDVKIEEFDFSKTAKTTESIVKNKALAENSTVSKKKNKTVQEEKSEIVVESKVSCKNIFTKMPKSTEKLCAEVPPAVDTEEKNDADGKSSKILRNNLESKPRKSRKLNVY